MLDRERLWRRVAAANIWPLAWGMAAACALPWLLPETWDGRLPRGLAECGWLAPLLLLWVPRRTARGAAAVLLFLWWGLLAHGRLARWETALPSGPARLEGSLDTPWRVDGSFRRSHLRVAAPAELAGLTLPLTLPAEGEPAPAPGTPVRVLGELRRIDPAPAFLAERPRWRARSEGAPRRLQLGSALQFEVLGPARPGPLLRLQCAVRARFDALPLPPGPARDLWGALTLGLPPAREESFSPFVESGTIHTLVVSGLQVTLVMAAVEALWRRLFRRGGAWASAVAGLLYSALVGFSAPVWRGLFMGLGWALGRGSGWKLPPALGLHLALLAWLAGHPAAGCDPGFLLAWWALLGLLWGAEPLAGLVSPLVGRWALPVARIAAPWFTTLPLLALLHGGAPTFGILANLLVLPMVSVLTPLCLGLTALPLPGLTQAAGAVLQWTGQALLPRFGHIMPLATGWLGPWILLALAWLALAHAHATLRRTRALAALLAAASLGLLAVRGTGTAPTTLSLEAADIGQGDALLLRIPGGEATLVDTGPNPWAARRIARLLSRRGVREPVHLLLSHPHRDHAGGWATLARLWPLASVAAAATATPEDWSPYRPPGAPAEPPLLRGMAWRRGAADFDVRWPPKPYALADPNMVSAVLRVRWRDRELWLMGDALALQERDLLALGDPPPGGPHRLIKLGHHGSRGASDPAWIAALAPEAALLCAGRRNPFGHPHPETLELLGRLGVPWWSSGASYGVRFEAGDGRWNVSTGGGDRLSVPCRTSPKP